MRQRRLGEADFINAMCRKTSKTGNDWYKRNSEDRTCNHWYSGKANKIMYSECL